MADKTITLSRELVERAVMRPGKESLAVNNADIIARGRAQAEIRELLADPVPPAGGEPEVLSYLYRHPSGEPWPRTYKDRQYGMTDWIETELVDRAHVTRLQAEVERLKEVAIARKDELTKLCTERNDLQSELTSANADKAAYGKNAVDLRLRVDALQAELTKARELLDFVVTSGGFSYATVAKDIREFLSNHSAPALIETLHANGDRIAMEAIIAQQAQRIADLEADKGQREP